MFKYTKNKRGSVVKTSRRIKGTETYLFWRPLMGATLLGPLVWMLKPSPVSKYLPHSVKELLASLHSLRSTG
jgi:hypothetical protein